MAKSPATACPLKTGARSQASYRGWPPQHRPAMLASDRKRPKISRQFTLAASPSGRQIHCLSEAERRFACLMLYHPDVFEVWDQYALDVNPGPHPLFNHPQAPSVRTVAHQGTLNLAASIGALQHHPRELKRDPQTGEVMATARNWITDFVLFIHPTDAEPYCVVWDIKSAKGLHGTPGPLNPIQRRSAQRVRRALVRQTVHSGYFEQLGIPVRSLYTQQLNETVIANLTRLCAWSSRESPLTQSQIDDLEAGFEEALRAGLPVFSRRKTCTPVQIEQENRVLFSAIWHRRLRVDLFSPILVDHPLVPESVDVLQEYAGWFSGE